MKIYLIDTDEVRRRDLSHIKKIMPQRYQKAQSYRRETDRLLCLGGAVLMIEKVGITDESAIYFNEYGKPAAHGFPEFNISHSGKICVIAVGASPGASPLGIDAEIIDKENLSAAEYVFSPEECEWMHGDPVVRFHRLWTMKESLLKAYGSGIDDDLPNLSVLPFVRGNTLKYKDIVWNAAEAVYKDYRICLCSADDIDSIEIERI